MRKKQINFDILESLRGLAALYVCIGHCRGVLWIGGEHYLKLHPRNTLHFTDYLVLGANMLTRLNPEMVIVFFVLSGFSIAHSLQKSKDPKPFYKRRFIRLYPPYITALIWAMLVVGLTQWIFPHFFDGTYKTPQFDRLCNSRGLFTWQGIVRNLFYYPQLGGVLTPFWSLTQEVIFYLLAPYLFRSKKIYYVVSIALFLFINTAYHFQWFPSSPLADFLHYNIFFVIGVALYNNYDSVLQKLQIFTTSKTIVIALVTYFAMIAISLAGHDVVNALVASFLSSILIIYLVYNAIKIKWLIAVGRFSYTLYISHFPTIFLYLCLYYLISKANPPYIFNNLLFIPCVFLCLGVAYLQYFFVEKQSKLVLGKMRKQQEGKKTIRKGLSEDEQIVVG
jgi:peptidoglycan/LPS O-acetylase OafA/YrhL